MAVQGVDKGHYFKEQTVQKSQVKGNGSFYESLAAVSDMTTEQLMQEIGNRKNELYEKVKKGEPMLKLDLEFLKANAPSLASPVLCTELEDNQKIRLLKEGSIKAGEGLFAVDFYE